jgi:hypothetical protein
MVNVARQRWRHGPHVFLLIPSRLYQLRQHKSLELATAHDSRNYGEVRGDRRFMATQEA